MLVREFTKERNELALGSYSSGTMRDEDLIPAFMDALESVDAKRAKSYRWANRKYFNFLDDMSKYSEEESKEREEMLPEITQELFDILDEYCPEYTYFGSHPGDGADYGVWVSDDSMEDDIRYDTLVKVEDLSELDDMMTEDCKIPKKVLVVNDHGNETLYIQTAKLEDNEDEYTIIIEREEVWSIV